MNAQALNKKIELIQWLATLEDTSIIEKLLKFREEEVKDWWDLVSEVEKNSIEKGVREADNKDLKKHSSARKIYEKCL